MSDLDQNEKPLMPLLAGKNASHMRKWRVEVVGCDRLSAHYWIVSATTEHDAIQLAFALDGGWSRIDFNASEMLELAKTYCTASLFSYPHPKTKE